MAGIPYNVYVATSRASYNPTTKVTSAPAPYLSNVLASVGMNNASAYAPLPESALRSEYTFMVPSGTDIVAGDIITSIVLLDGITPWPGDVPPQGKANTPLITWFVNYAAESPPGFLMNRMIYVSRTFSSGPVHL